MLDKKSVEDIEVQGKKVLVRCDFNVPLDLETKTTITNDDGEEFDQFVYVNEKGELIKLKI